MMRRLLYLNGLAILSVVVFHGAGWGFTAMFAWGDRLAANPAAASEFVGTPTYFALRLIEQLAVFSIPAFLFVSGFFAAFALPNRFSARPWGAMGARIRSLVAPYLFWSAVLILGLGLQGRAITPGSAARMLLTGSASPAYYYVPLLVQLYLLSPLLAPLARSRPGLLLGAAAALQLGIYGAQYAIVLGGDSPAAAALIAWLPKWLFVVRLFWFAAGMVAGYHMPRLNRFLARWKWALLGAGALAALLGVAEWEALYRLSGLGWLDARETLIDGVYAGCVVLSLLALSHVRLPASGVVSELGARSYGIYLLHPPVMEAVSRGLYHFAPWVLASQALLLPLLVGLGLGLPMLAMTIVRRSPARRLYQLQFG